MKHAKYKNHLKIVLLLFFLVIGFTGCQRKTVETPKTVTTKEKNKTVKDDQILHVSAGDDESAIINIYLENEENVFDAIFFNKYDVGIHSKSYKIILKSKYKEMTDRLEMDMPASSAVTHLYITIENYTFIVALFEGTELISRMTLDISKYNQESENFLCKGSADNKNIALGLSRELADDLVIYKTTLLMVHGDEEWNEDNEENITLSVALEEQ